MAPKLRQMALSFAPRAVLPDQRAEGAVVAIAADRPAIQAAVSSTGLDAAPLKKPRRELNLAAKNEILNFRKTHTAKETLAKFPEVSPSTLKRIQRHAGQIEKAYHSGRGSTKRKVPLKMYKARGEKLHEFFMQVRDAHGAVTRGLLEEFAAGLPPEITHTFMSKGAYRRDEFFSRWRKWYGIVYRRVTGVKQYLPHDHPERIRTFHSLLRSMYLNNRYTTIFCGDETGVRFEELPSVTMAPRGSQKVPIASSGQEKTIFTVFLHSSLGVDDWGNPKPVRKEPPVIIFKGAAEGPVSRSIAQAADGRAGEFGLVVRQI